MCGCRNEDILMSGDTLFIGRYSPSSPYDVLKWNFSFRLWMGVPSYTNYPHLGCFSCGRLDLPDCDAKAMYTSLQKKLASLPSNTRVYPGHDYGGPFTTISHEKKQGFLKPVAEKEWLRMHRL
jgi:glyoxylase-like metal-dependent hydrolase (beta-lactamase superfamily II)